jgi:hypothetical protein
MTVNPVRRIDAAATTLKDEVNKYGRGCFTEDEFDRAIAACAEVFRLLRAAADRQSPDEMRASRP